MLVDSHSARRRRGLGPAGSVLARAPVKGVVLERDEDLPPFGRCSERSSGRGRSGGATADESPRAAASLARVVTASDLREGFLDDPETVAKPLGYDAQAVRTLAAIPAVQIRHYSKSLVNKRC